MTTDDTPGRPLRVTMFLRRPVPGWHSMEELFATVREHLPPDIEVEVVTLSHPSRGLLPRLRNMWQAWRHRGEVNHVTGDVHYIALALPRARTVLTVHDVVGLVSLRGLRRWVLELLWYRLPVWWVAAVTTISDSTRTELLRLLPAAADKLVVIGNAINPDFLRGPPAPDDPTAPVLCLGTTQNKNLERSIGALAGAGGSLRVVGHLTELQESLLEQTSVEYTSVADLTRADLHAVYRSSSLLLFPSLNEGFGMPILEAQAVGIPVITSDREPMRSIAGDGAVLVDPTSVTDIRRAIDLVRGDPDLRRSLVAAGRANQRRFQPSATAADYGALYRRLQR